MKSTIKTVLLLSIFSILFLTGCGGSYNEAKQKLDTADLGAGSTIFSSKGCTGCHGVDGGLEALGVSRVIADIATERDVESALYSLRAQIPQRDPIMLNEAKDLTDQEILDLSIYIFSLRH